MMDVRNAADLIWKDGEFVDWGEAQTHVLSHALHYGTGLFEGCRLYETADGSAIFRFDEHIDRLYQTAGVHKIEIPFSRAEIKDATVELINRQGIQSGYIRPVVYRGYDKLGLNPQGCQVEVAVAVIPNVSYLSKDGLDAFVSSWRRFDSNISPTQAKTTGMYFNSALANQEAVRNGYDEAIFINQNGTVAEGPGENLFVVRDDEVYTVGPAGSVLDGITKNTVIELARQDGIPVHDRATVDRSELYTSDELFYAGTAAEIKPIRSVDDRTVTQEPPGKHTQRVMDLYDQTITQMTRDDWFTQVSS
jgi:branched chain amino acid aminotransferase apoenzyme (EC 2.6.1.42)